MNKLYLISSLICIFISPLTAESQDSSSDENIFVVFGDSEFEKHKFNKSDEDIFGEYNFLVAENEKDPSDQYHKGLITLVDKKYSDFDAKLSNNPLPKFRVNKSFLRKNKGQILSIEQMRQLGFNKVFQIFFNAKHIFLIDKSETKEGKILIKEVQLFYLGEE